MHEAAKTIILGIGVAAIFVGFVMITLQQYGYLTHLGIVLFAMFFIYLAILERG